MPQQPYASPLRSDAYSLDAPHRDIVLQAIREAAARHGWMLLAAHVRSTHVHVVVTADCKPEKVMNQLKAASSRDLNRAALDEPGRLRWARHGSTRFLWTRDSVAATIDYVVHEQGEPMSLYCRGPEK